MMHDENIMACRFYTIGSSVALVISVEVVWIGYFHVSQRLGEILLELNIHWHLHVCFQADLHVKALQPRKTAIHRE